MRALIIIIAASVAFPLFADTPRAVQLVGHWRYTNSSAKRIDDITFAADGTYTGRVTQDGKLLGEFAGKWAVEGSTLSYHYTRSSIPQIPVGLKDQDKLLQVTKDYYVIAAIDGGQRRWLRVR